MYTIRPVSEKDILEITKIYNNNIKFLEKHIGCSSVDENFINSEIKEMKLSNFISTCIVDFESDNAVGVIDYNIGETEVYLSLIMIDSNLQGNGLGKSLYRHFERLMKDKNQKVIKIDVVNDYENNLVSFWESLGFVSDKEIELVWGCKRSKAFVMKKIL